QTRRRAMDCRRTVVGSGHEEVLRALQTLNPENVSTRRLPETVPSVAFLFPALADWRPQPWSELYEEEPVFRKQIDLCAGLLELMLDIDLHDDLFANRETCRIAQPAQFALEYALAKLWMNWGIRPTAMIGHGSSEYATACLAGVVSLKDVLR